MSQPILFFDGVCHLCNGYINLLIKLDTKHRIFFSPLQGKTAPQFLSLAQRETLDSILYFKNNLVLEKSDAVIESITDVSLWFLWAKIFYIVPKVIRNFVYDLIARNRYRLFGKEDLCRIPTTEERKYLLD